MSFIIDFADFYYLSMIKQRLISKLSLFSHAKEVSSILSSAISAVHPQQAVKRFVKYDGGRYFSVAGQQYDLAADHVHVIGGGKGVLPMANALYEIFQERLVGGAIVSKHLFENSLPECIHLLTGSHPVPDEKSIKSAQCLADYTTRIEKMIWFFV